MVLEGLKYKFLASDTITRARDNTFANIDIQNRVY